LPWNVTDPMLEKTRFIVAVEAAESSFSDVCAEFGIARQTGYRWWRRYQAEQSLQALAERSRRPQRSPTATPDPIVEMLLAARQRRPTRGARKLLAALRRKHPELAWPSDTTGHRILERHGLITRAHPRPRGQYPSAGGPFPSVYEPNEVWTTDFKGQFRLGNGDWCYPLTICDLHSRFALGCYAQESTTTPVVQRNFTRTFSEYGLPERIRSDNGTPFATKALCGLSGLSVWFLKLGIGLERIKPGRPQQNGQHERFHRTLKAEAIQPPATRMELQQLRFNEFLKEFNLERPHDALRLDVPAQHYRCSNRAMPSRNDWPGLDYPEHWERRQVQVHGGFKWKGTYINLTEALRGEPIALERVGEGVWLVRFSVLILGVLRGDGSFVPA
jgi:putative transposase